MDFFNKMVGTVAQLVSNPAQEDSMQSDQKKPFSSFRKKNIDEDVDSDILYIEKKTSSDVGPFLAHKSKILKQKKKTKDFSRDSEDVDREETEYFTAPCPSEVKEDKHVEAEQEFLSTLRSEIVDVSSELYLNDDKLESKTNERTIDEIKPELPAEIQQDKSTGDEISANSNTVKDKTDSVGFLSSRNDSDFTTASLDKKPPRSNSKKIRPTSSSTKGATSSSTTATLSAILERDRESAANRKPEPKKKSTRLTLRERLIKRSAGFGRTGKTLTNFKSTTTASLSSLMTSETMSKISEATSLLTISSTETLKTMKTKSKAVSHGIERDMEVISALGENIKIRDDSGQPTEEFKNYLYLLIKTFLVLEYQQIESFSQDPNWTSILVHFHNLVDGMLSGLDFIHANKYPPTPGNARELMPQVLRRIDDIILEDKSMTKEQIEMLNLDHMRDSLNDPSSEKVSPTHLDYIKHFRMKHKCPARIKSEANLRKVLEIGFINKDKNVVSLIAAGKSMRSNKAEVYKSNAFQKGRDAGLRLWNISLMEFNFGSKRNSSF